jgi:hypothetical protein
VLDYKRHNCGYVGDDASLGLKYYSNFIKRHAAALALPPPLSLLAGRLKNSSSASSSGPYHQQLQQRMIIQMYALNTTDSEKIIRRLPAWSIFFQPESESERNVMESCYCVRKQAIIEILFVRVRLHSSVCPWISIVV